MPKFGSYAQLSVAAILSLNLIACGDSTTLDISPENTQPEVNESNDDAGTLKTLRFVDSAVEGLTVVSGVNGEIVHVTNSDGDAQYSGESVRFYIGDKDNGQPLGDLILVPEDGIVTPQHVVEAESPFDDSVLNMVSWLMGLDDDRNPDNGIKLSQAVREQSNSTVIDFEQSSEDFRNDANVINRFSNLSQEIQSGDSTLPSSADARAHFRNTLRQLNLLENQDDENDSDNGSDSASDDSVLEETELSETELLNDKLNGGSDEESAPEDSDQGDNSTDEDSDKGTDEVAEEESSSDAGSTESDSQNENGSSNDSNGDTGISGDSLVSLATVIANSDTCAPLDNVSSMRRGITGLGEDDSNWVSNSGGFLAYTLADGEQNWYFYSPATRRVRRVAEISDFSGDYPVVCQAHFES